MNINDQTAESLIMDSWAGQIGLLPIYDQTAESSVMDYLATNGPNFKPITQQTTTVDGGSRQHAKLSRKRIATTEVVVYLLENAYGSHEDILVHPHQKREGRRNSTDMVARRPVGAA